MKRSFIIFLHSGYWLLYLFLIFGFLLFVPNGYRHGPLSVLFRILFASPITINFILFEVIGFYIFYSVLFPRLLYKKKFLSLFVSAIIVCVLSSGAGMLLSSLIFKTKSLSLAWQDQVGMILFLSILVGIHGTIGLVIRGFITWYSDIKLKEELNQKNYETELALVKSQINPHFLFNTINNIDVLILKDGEKASTFLNKLSDIMRFMLYETKAEKIPLQKNLTILKTILNCKRSARAIPILSIIL
jgi:two-component system LytT family sensor kinase